MLRRRSLLFALTLVLLPASLTVRETAAQSQRAGASEAEYKARFDAAIALHDRGQYDAAIAAFGDLLRIRPEDPTLLCELANTLFAAQRFEEAIRQAEHGLAQPGASVPFCSNTLGSALDSSGDYKQGEKVFRKAIKAAPDVPLLHFNLAVNQAQQKRPEGAIEEFEEAIRLKPSHASSWRGLAIAWQGQRMRPHAFAAFTRFLALEPTGPRAEAALPQLEALLFQGVEDKGNDPATGKGNISITVEPGDKRKAEAAASLGMIMSIVAAGRFTEDWKDKSDAAFLAYALDSVLKIFEETSDADGRKNGFWTTSVMPYFRDARAAGHSEALVWEVRRSKKDPEVTAWLEEHAAAVADFHAWSAAWKPPAPAGGKS